MTGASRDKLRARRRRGWFELAVPIDLFGEPLKPFPIFLRTCALTVVFDVAAQFAPSDAHRAAQQFVDHVQRNEQPSGSSSRTPGCSMSITVLRGTSPG